MVRGAATLIALLLLLAPAAQARTRAKLIACEPGAAEFRARMDARPEAAEMRMRFRLQWRRDGDWERVPAGWREWISSSAQRLVWTKYVEGLVGPGEYRVAVRFRWLDAAGDVVLRKRRTSPACAQASP